MSLSAKPEKVRQINIPILKTQYSTCRTNYGQRAEEPAGNSQYCRLVPSPITARGCYARLRSHPRQRPAERQRQRWRQHWTPPRWHRVMTSQARPPFSRPSGIEKAPLEIPKGASPSYRCAFSRKMDRLPLSYRLRRANQIPRPATATPAIATPTVGTREVPVEGSFPPPTGPSGTWGEPGSPGSSGLS